MRFLILFLLFQSTEPLSDRVLVQDHQHRPAAVAPMTLPEIEAAALENNREIRVMHERVDLAKAGVTPALALDDPSFMLSCLGHSYIRAMECQSDATHVHVQPDVPCCGETRAAI